MPKFHIDSVAPKYKDVQRNWLFEFTIPEISRIVPFVLPEGLQTRVRSASIPGSSINEITSEYMGTQEFHAGKKTPTTDVSIEFEETEDTVIHSCFYSWTEMIQALDPNSGNAGVSAFAVKRGGYAVDAFLNLFSYDGKDILQSFKFINLWPKGMPAVDVAYANSENIKYTMEFKFDQLIRID